MHREDWRMLPAALAAALEALFHLEISVPSIGDHPALGWSRSGMMAVTGQPDGPALMSPVALTVLADSAISALRAMSRSSRLPENGAMLLGQRAQMLRLSRHGATSANGSCRLVPCADGIIALNLPRADDWDLASAMVGEVVADWYGLLPLLAGFAQADLIARGRMLGLALAPNKSPPPMALPFTVEQLSMSARRPDSPMVIDLSALWAGPLAGALLCDIGANVVKVESLRRPDGARAGNAAFFTSLNAGKTQIMLDFESPGDRTELHTLVRKADIIIEASRPRALRALGIDARTEVARGATWLSITAHGRAGEAGDAIGFGDDAAVAGGLTAHMQDIWGEAIFAGDAIADPLTGILAALCGWASWCAGGGRLVSIPMAAVVGFGCGWGAADRDEALHWQAMAEKDRTKLYPFWSRI